MAMDQRIEILPSGTKITGSASKRSRRSDRKGHTPGRPIGRRRRLHTTMVLLAGLLAFSSLLSLVFAGNNQDDDAAAAANDDAAAAAGDDADADGEGDEDGDNAEEEADQPANYKDADDDVFRWDQNVGFHWDRNVGFDGVSVMPLSCVNYNSGHMIKFQLFDTSQSYQCHFAEISTFVVSISHYMRAYFNYKALTMGSEFSLPSDAVYLNCVALHVDGMGNTLYAKVGCMDKETFTSTRLQLHLYTDQQCSQKFDDGQTSRQHATKGYLVNGNRIATKMTFNPEFLSCQTCSPDAIAETFNKLNSNWYDDDFISRYGGKEAKSDAEDHDDANKVDDLYYKAQDDNYQAADDATATDDDQGDRRMLSPLSLTPLSAVESFKESFWSDIRAMQRGLQNDYYDIGQWNMCQRIYKYGVWCDEECKALDFFRTDQWSQSDVILLAVMCTFLTAMMLLILAKRLKAQQKARIYGDDYSMPGLPPCAMAIIFGFVMFVILGMAQLKFINETLVFAVVTCILLFIYMLKLTLFENRRPVLLAAPRHDVFDNPLDDRLFD